MVWQIIVGAIVIGIVYMLVKPDSPAAAGVAASTTVLSNLITAAVTGGNTP